jgi:hypothetical protein
LPVAQPPPARHPRPAAYRLRQHLPQGRSSAER